LKQTLLTQLGLVQYGCIAFTLFISSPALGQSQQPADSISTRVIPVPDSLQPQYTAQALQHEQFNQGLITSLEQAITGQFAGLRIIAHSGRPGAPYTMAAGHGNSYVGNNSPLLVVDGIILDYADISPNTGFLSFLNPEDVASVEFLRDAAATAVYGGRAVNGVLVINTKSGRSDTKTRVQFNSTGAVSSLRRKADVLTGDEIRNVLQTKYPKYSHLAGTHNTDWQDVIYQNGYGLDNNLSLSGAIKSMPYRISAGHLSQQGILKTSGRDRSSFALNLNPSLFNEHLTLNASLLHSRQELRVANEQANFWALEFDPTQPVYAPNEFGGYYLHTRYDGEPYFYYPNPLGMLEQRVARDHIYSWVGQAHLRYKLHFLPSVSLNYRRALRHSDSDYRIITDPIAAYYSPNVKLETQKNKSKIDYDEAFLDYTQALPGLQGLLSFTGGFLKSKWSTFSENVRYHQLEGPGNTSGERLRYRKEDLAYYGNLQFAWRDKFSTLLSMRRDWSTSPIRTLEQFDAQSIGVNFSWDIKKEAFLSQVSWLSQLKATVSGGLFERLENPNQYLLLHNNQYSTWHDVVAEKTLAKRLDLSYGLWNNKLLGSLVYYHNQSSDLLLSFLLPPAMGYPRYVGRTAGALRTTGLETTFMYKAIDKGDVYLNLGLNASWMNSEVLSFKDNLKQFFYHENHNRYIISEVGRPIHSFDMFTQMYDPDGKPKPMNHLAARNVVGNALPQVISGLQTNAGYGKWHASMLLRGSFGNDVYNFVDMSGSWFNPGQTSTYLRNASSIYEKTGFNYHYSQSDYFLESASFVRLEYLQLQYDFGRIAGNKANLRLHATAQNAFVLTKYSGRDPETRSGLDIHQTPRPRTISVGLNLGI
jgi:TonB-dependent starch-binding outer membrane protein SusC